MDVGLALYKGQDVKVNVFSGSSALEPGSATGKMESIDKILSPITQKEAAAIRCIGLNVRFVETSELRVVKLGRSHLLQYKQHAAEVGMDLPTIPTLFMYETL